jgi:branched-chain amino acid transport system substrate-binding protein
MAINAANTPLTRTATARRARVFFVTIFGVLTLLSGCSKDTTPIPIGFVGGLTGRTADLAISGRNGLQLAIEQANAAGGIDGRPITLEIRDTEAKIDRAELMVSELIAAKVAAIVGPMTSAEAAAAAPIADKGRTLMMASTVTTTGLSAKDDHFFRVVSDTTQHTATMAEHLIKQRKVQRVHVLVNLANKSYTQSWADGFSQAARALGAPEPVRTEYTSADNTRFDTLAATLHHGAPDAIILVTNAVDAAHTAKQLTRLGSRAVHVVSEWAGTGKLTELGGGSVEGYIVPQYLDLASANPAYIAFREAYQKRYAQDPGFPAVNSYNVAQILVAALREQRSDEPLKQTLLRMSTFDGLQGPIRFDQFGDVQSPTHLTEVRDGHYVPLN